MRKEFRSLISLEEAKSIVLSRLPQTATEVVSLERARGRILAEKIISPLDVPGFHRASMDGYAVRSEDTLASREDRPAALRLAGSVPMGKLPELQVGQGEAAEVSTGSMIPNGADAVVMIEYIQAKGDRIFVHRPVHNSENVQATSSDISFGEAVLFPGTMLNTRELGVLAAIGQENVKVRSLKAGVASTGNELVSLGRLLGPGQIYDINSHTIAASVRDCGAEALGYGILPDDKIEMANTLQKMATECDMIFVSGSTSAGVGDMIYQVLDEIGETLFHGVNLKPGKPTIFGVIDNKPCLGLPGYPTSALTVFELLAAPAIRKALGTKLKGKTTAGRMAKPFRAEGRQQMLAVGISGELVYPVDKGSGSITTLSNADGIIEIAAGVEYLEQGSAVEVKLFGELEPPDLVVAGENSVILEKLAEILPIHVRLMNTGSARGKNDLLDGLADLACVSALKDIPTGLTSIKSYKRELGFIFKDESDLQDLESKAIVGWHRDSHLKILFEQILKDLGFSSLKYVRLARTHSAVAAAVASGRADAGFGEKEAAREAGLGFKFLTEDEIKFLARPESLTDPIIKHFISALP
jgi:putative molybdopterin biosynthesis protein